MRRLGESMDQRLQVSDKTMAAIIADEKKLNNTGLTVKSSRFAIVLNLPNLPLVFVFAF